jgi:hypothetical protein
MSPAWIIALILTVLAGGSFWLTVRLIGTVGQHAAGHERFDWSEELRPLFNRGRPDRLDQLIAQYCLPDKALEQLLDTDRLIARADRILRPA